MERLDTKDTQMSPQEESLLTARDLGLFAREIEERDFLQEAVAIVSRRSMLLPERGHLEALYGAVVESEPRGEYLFVVPRNGMLMLCEQWSTETLTLEKAKEYAKRIGAVLYAAKLC